MAAPGPGNVITEELAPNVNALMAEYPATKLAAAGEAVGLPMGEDGNSEVGHLNIGAGRVVPQSMPRINMAIVDGSFFINRILLEAVQKAKEGAALHLLGLIGSGGVHAYNDHLLALLQLCKKHELKEVYLHLFTDGRDSPPNEAKIHITNIENELRQLQMGQVATLMGRYYAMDRDLRWERTQKAYVALTEVGEHLTNSALEAIEASYSGGTTDEFIEPVQIGAEPAKSRVKDGDVVIFFNFRIDRPRQLTKAFVLPDFENQTWSIKQYDPGEVYYHENKAEPEAPKPFVRKIVLKNLTFVTMTEYEKGLPVDVAFPPIIVTNNLGEIVSKAGLRQLRIAESEKERFVTKYFNGNQEITYEREERIIIPSDKVATYDQKPEMQTPEIIAELLMKLDENIYDFYVVNIAAPDMVAHTGNMEATKRAISTVDRGIRFVVKAIERLDGVLLITADHGNAEELFNLKSGQADTEHSVNPVPFIIVDKELKGKTMNEGVLGDVAPTLLSVIGIPQPTELTGKVLIN